MATYVLIKNATATGTAPSPTLAPPQAQAGAQSVNPTGPSNPNSPTQTQMIQVFASTTSGNVAATAQVYGSNDQINWTAAGAAIAISSTALYGAAALQLALPYKYFTAILTALSGTGASASVTMSA